MTPEQMAKEIGALAAPYGFEGEPGWEKETADIIRAALAEEREACAQIADDKKAELWPTVDGGMGTRAAEDIAAEIRARKS